MIGIKYQDLKTVIQEKDFWTREQLRKRLKLSMQESKIGVSLLLADGLISSHKDRYGRFEVVQQTTEFFDSLSCEDCGQEFTRSKEYMAQKRTDSKYKWKTKKCDSCVDIRVSSAFKNMGKVLNALTTE